VSCCGGTDGRETSANCRTPSSGASSPVREVSSPPPTSPFLYLTQDAAPPREPEPARQGIESIALRELERKAIIDALERTHGNKGRAARLLGLTRFQLYSRLKRHDIDVSAE
jgi:transcriptional regulator with GAF, ATPase, and Fis domain